MVFARKQNSSLLKKFFKNTFALLNFFLTVRIPPLFFFFQNSLVCSFILRFSHIYIFLCLNFSQQHMLLARNTRKNQLICVTAVFEQQLFSLTPAHSECRVFSSCNFQAFHRKGHDSIQCWPFILQQSPICAAKWLYSGACGNN